MVAAARRWRHVEGVVDSRRVDTAFEELSPREVVDGDVTPRRLVAGAFEVREVGALPGEIVMSKERVAPVENSIEDIARRHVEWQGREVLDHYEIEGG
jgi:hypothetical protein